MRDYEYEKAIIAHWGIPGQNRPTGLKYNVKKKREDDIDDVQKNKIRAATATGRVIMRSTNNNARNQSDTLEKMRAGSVAEARKAKAVRDAQNARKEYLKKKYNTHREEKEELVTRSAMERLKKASNPFANDKNEMKKKKTNKVEKQKVSKEGYENSVLGQVENRVKEKKKKNINDWNDTVAKLKIQYSKTAANRGKMEAANKKKKQKAAKEGYENSFIGQIDKKVREKNSPKQMSEETRRYKEFEAKSKQKETLRRLGMTSTKKEQDEAIKKIKKASNPFEKSKKKKG